MANAAWWQVRDRRYLEEEAMLAASKKLQNAIVGQDKWGLQARQQKAEAEGTTLFQERQPINAFQALGNVGQAWHSEFVEPAAGALAYPFSKSVRESFSEAREKGEPGIHALRTGKQEGLQDMPWGAVGALELIADPLNIIPGIGFGGAMARGVRAGGRGLTRVSGEALARTPLLATGETGMAGALERATFGARRKGVEILAGRPVPQVAGGSEKIINWKTLSDNELDRVINGKKPRGLTKDIWEVRKNEAQRELKRRNDKANYDSSAAGKQENMDKGRKLGENDAGNPDDPSGTIENNAANIPPPVGTDRLVGMLGTIEDKVKSIVTRDNRLVRWIVGKTGINPSILLDSAHGKALLGYQRLIVDGQNIIDAAIGSGIGSHLPGGAFGSADLMRFMNIDKKGYVVGTGRKWNDVFSSDKLTKQFYNADQQALVKDYRRIIDEIELQRRGKGLNPLTTEGMSSDWFYIPRQVINKEGIEIDKPTKASLKRVYEEATTGEATGRILYESDPVATLRVHARTAFKEMAQHELDNEVLSMGVSYKGLMSPRIIAKWTSLRANWKRQQQNKLAIQQRIRALTTVDDPSLTEARNRSVQLANWKKREQLKKALRKTENNLAKARSRQNAYRNRIYKDAVNRAKNQTVAEGDIFSRGQGKISIAKWRNKFFPEDVVKDLEKQLGPVSQESGFSGKLEKLANTIRFTAAVGDFALPFIQGLPLLGTRPDLWAKATLNHYKAFFNPAVQGRYMRDNINVLKEMAENGVPVGDVEFFTAIREGGGFSADLLYKQLAKGDEYKALISGVAKQTVGRFQASYDAGLTSIRVELWKALRHKMEPGPLAQYVRNMTGGLDTRYLGASATQRRIESVWLAFSPRLLRSTLALVKDAVNPHTPEGKQAFISLSGMAAVMSGIFVTTGLALGKSWDEIQEGLNPLNGREFLAHEINGNYVGFGGQFRSLTQLTARLIAAGDVPILPSRVRTDQRVLAGGIMTNPLLQQIFYRGAPGFNIMGSVAERMLDRDIHPFADVRSTPNLLLHLGESALPFALQGLLDGESALTFPMAIAGLRTAPPMGSGRRGPSGAGLPTPMGVGGGLPTPF